MVVVLPVLLGSINALVVCGNMFVLYILVSQKSLHTSTNSIVFSLTLSDFLLGILILPFSIIQEFTSSWHFGTAWCRTWLSLDILLSTASIYNLLAISFDRYMAVKQPIKYGRLISSSRLTKFTITAVWLLSGALALPPFVSDDLFLVTASRQELDALLEEGNYSETVLQLADTCTPVTNSDAYILFSATISFVLPMILMVGLNASIFCTVLDSKRKLSQSPFALRSCSLGQHPESVERVLRVHRGGSSARTPTTTTTTTTTITAAPDGASSSCCQATSRTKEQILARRSMTMLKKASLGNHLLQNYFAAQMPRGIGTGNAAMIVHQQSLPSSAMLLNSFSLSSDCHHHQSLPGSRKGTMDSQVGPQQYQHIARGNKDTFNTSLESVDRRRGLREIWLNRIKQIKLSHRRKGCPSTTSVGMPPAPLLRKTMPSGGDVRRCLLAQEAALRAIPAVRNNHQHHRSSILEYSANRSVWFPAVVTSLFAGGADGPKRPKALCRRHSERLLLQPTLATQQQAKNALCTELRVARTIAVVVGCFTCCWLPFSIIYVLQAFHLCPVGACVPDWLFTLSFWLGYTNSALNPLLYAAFSRDFRNAFRRILMRRDRSSSFRSSG